MVADGDQKWYSANKTVLTTGAHPPRWAMRGNRKPRKYSFIDKGFSGTTRKNRAGLDNALAAVTSAAAAVADRQVVLTTTKFDRFARNMAEAGEVFEEAQIELDAASDALDRAGKFTTRLRPVLFD
jgi:hypothetical protein